MQFVISRIVSIVICYFFVNDLVLIKKTKWLVIIIRLLVLICGERLKSEQKHIPQSYY